LAGRKKMLTTLQHFFYMSGYGFYVFSAYGSVFLLLAVQWFLPWRRWQRYLRAQRKSA
jgi:heme exporter protein CcmD